MTAATYSPSGGRPDGAILSTLKDRAREKFEDFARSPSMSLPLPGGKRAQLATDRVRAAPAIAPNLSLMIGQTALGLGVWGLLFPKAVKRTLGVTAAPGMVRLLFGAREFATGVALTGDPTKAEVLWGRVAADVFDIAVLSSLTRPTNPSRRMAKAGLAFVLAVTALDLVTAVRMSTVKRNCE